jgi:RNA polymerase sigma-70 factor (ECF subfamily)
MTQELAAQFEQHRARLHAVAYRVLGSSAEADDAVQEAWLRVDRAGTEDVENVAGWLTTVVARVALNVLRSRTNRREDPLEAVEPRAEIRGPADPEAEAVLADSVGLALLVVLDTLSPAERLAFVLHDLFDVPFDEIAPIVDRSPAAARQLASRARRRVQGGAVEDGAREDPDLARRREVVEAFLAASRDGDFAGLLALLDPEVVLRADAAAVAMGGPAEVRGADGVARVFSGRARAVRLALVDGAPAAVWAVRGEPRVVFAFTVVDGRVGGIEQLADPDRLAAAEVEYPWPQRAR